MSRLRVLIVAFPPDQIGGQEHQAAGLLSRLQHADGVTASFVSVTPRLPGPLALLVRVRYVRTVVQTIALTSLLLVRVPRCDVVHVLAASHLSFLVSATPPILVGRLFRRKIVVNYHAGGAEDHLARWGRSALPVLRRADAIVLPSGLVARSFERRGLATRILPNAIDAHAFPFRERAPLRPVFLANRALRARYNVACVLRAFGLVKAAHPDARLIVAGDGPERERLEALAGELGLRDVRFAGWAPPDVWLNGSDVDAQPLSILEAWAAGLPVVTTAAVGIPELVDDGVTGLVVETGDHAALAAAAERLLGEPELAASMVAAGRRRAVEFDWESAVTRWLALYRELVGARA
jgi:L-malate glycosyltransferase